MTMFIFKRLMAYLIIVTVLMTPLHSVAREMTSETAQGSCTSLLMTADCSVDNSSQQPDQCPGDSSGDCCDSEGCAQDAAVPPAACHVKVNSSVTQPLSTDTHNHIPKVYLAIFVPPER